MYAHAINTQVETRGKLWEAHPLLPALCGSSGVELRPSGLHSDSILPGSHVPGCWTFCFIYSLLVLPFSSVGNTFHIFASQSCPYSKPILHGRLPPYPASHVFEFAEQAVLTNTLVFWSHSSLSGYFQNDYAFVPRIFFNTGNWAYWYMPVIPALQWQRQEGQVFKVILSYAVFKDSLEHTRSCLKMP